MSTILIQNPGELPIWGMRLLGLSNKREDQIGRFGTGLKESIALLSRMDISPIIFSGTNRIDFSTQQLDEQDEICFKMTEPKGRFAANEWHGLGIHPNFGKADWDDPWMVFRELICNSLDEGGVDNLFHDVVTTDPEGVAGSTRIYVPNNAMLMSAYSVIGDRLLMLGDSEIVHTFSDRTHTLAKRRQRPAQIYHREVWVQEDTRESLYDYNLNQLKLNESRSADWYDVNGEVAYAMASWPVELVRPLLHAVIEEKKDTTNLFEASLLNSTRYYSNSADSRGWKQAFFDLYGETAVMTDNDAYFYDKLRALGFKPVIVMNTGLREVLRGAGVREPGDVLTVEQAEWDEVVEAQPDQRSCFDKVWAKLESMDLTRGKTKPKLQIFTPREGGDSVVFGAYKDGVCRINSKCIGSQHERVACLEEIAHHVTGEKDFTRAFQMYLMEALDAVLFEKKAVAK